MKRTLDLTPHHGEMLKPRELIDISGIGHLTLFDRRVYNTLIEHAWGRGLADEERVFTVPTSAFELHRGAATSKDLDRSIDRLMRTLVVVKSPDGCVVDRAQLLGPTRIDMRTTRGEVRYRFSTELAALLRDSTIFAKLDMQVMRAFSSKYALSLYEGLARRLRMNNRMEIFSIEGMRDLLGVEAGKYEKTKNLNSRAIQPAFDEVNSLTNIRATVVPKKEGRSIVGYVVGWDEKDPTSAAEAAREMERPRIGRKARLDGTAEYPAMATATGKDTGNA